MFYIGCHLSCAKGYLQMAKDAERIGATTFQFFTRNPRGGSAKALDDADIAAFLKKKEELGIGTLVAHAPYTLNAAGQEARVREFAESVMADDLRRLEYTPGALYNFHPGSHVGQGAEAGIELISSMLNRIIASFGGELSTTVLLETMSGKGSEVGRDFAELAAIIERVEHPLGVCLDTCHVWDAGCDIVGDLDGVLADFDRVIGLDRLKAVHLNDSMNVCGAHKDRHEKIGKGRLGLDGLAAVINHPRLRELPFYLETPCDLQEYKEEIALLRGLAK
jgi:deoxyribonuclease-4